MTGSLIYTYVVVSNTSAQTDHLINNRAKLMSIKVAHAGTQGTPTIKFYDKVGSASNLIWAIKTAAGSTYDYDFHGGILGEGLYVTISAPGTPGADNIVISAQAS